MALPRYVLVRSICNIISVDKATAKTATRFTDTSAPASTAARVEYEVRSVWSFPVKSRYATLRITSQTPKSSSSDCTPPAAPRGRR